MEGKNGVPRHPRVPVGRASIAALVAAAAVRGVVLCSYPPNLGGDCIGYYRMLVHGRSNLVHPSGYPLLMGWPLRASLSATGRRWMLDVHPIPIQYTIVAAQHGAALCALAALGLTASHAFSPWVGSLAMLFHGLSPTVVGAANVFFPEWLQADLAVLALCAGYWAWRSAGAAGKVLFHGLMFLASVACYLVKYNALLLAPAIPLLVLADRGMRWRVRLLVLCAGLLLWAGCVAGFIRGFHRPSTGTSALSRDHAWVLLTALGRWVPGERLHPEAGPNTKRLLYLNAVLPWDPREAGPFWGTDATPEGMARRAPWREKYLYVLGADEPVLDERLATVPPPPSPYPFFTAFLPTSLYIGMDEGDRLGVKVFFEHLRAFPGAFLLHWFNEIGNTLRRWPEYRALETDLAPPRYEPLGRLGLYRREQVPAERSPLQAVWYSRPIVWKPGAAMVAALRKGFGFVPTWVIALGIAAYVAAQVRASSSGRGSPEGKTAMVLAGILVFYLGTSHGVFFRWKEALPAMPVAAVLAAAAVCRGVRIASSYFFSMARCASDSSQ